MKMATCRSQFSKLIRDCVGTLGLCVCGSILSRGPVRRGTLHCDTTDFTGQLVFIWVPGLNVFMLKIHRRDSSSTLFLKVVELERGRMFPMLKTSLK